jgi:ubiquinone/menaquinone biosynthesis C-methylase UbiE
MALSDLFAQNVFVRWITGNRQKYELAVSMTGVKLGERLLQVGCGDAGLLAALGAKVGYTGRACAVDADASTAARAAQVAEKAGVLVETAHAPYARLPYDAESFDLVVLRPTGTTALLGALQPAFPEARRVLRTGGRCIVILDAKARTGAVPNAPAESIHLLNEHGFRGARSLAERDDLVFIEALKARS